MGPHPREQPDRRKTEQQVVFRFSYVYIILETSPSRSWVPTYLPTFHI